MWKTCGRYSPDGYRPITADRCDSSAVPYLERAPTRRFPTIRERVPRIPRLDRQAFCVEAKDRPPIRYLRGLGVPSRDTERGVVTGERARGGHCAPDTGRSTGQTVIGRAVAGFGSRNATNRSAHPRAAPGRCAVPVTARRRRNRPSTSAARAPDGHNATIRNIRGGDETTLRPRSCLPRRSRSGRSPLPA